MANTVITHPAQKLKIKHIKGSQFKLVVNVKDSDGSNYSFQGVGAGNTNLLTNTNFDQATFYVYAQDGSEMQVIGVGGQPLNANLAFNETVEDGKITINYNGLGNPFSPPTGKYKYTLVTNWVTSTAAEQTVWLYGDFIVEDIQPYSSDATFGV
jgi:hypothetical protein